MLSCVAREYKASLTFSHEPDKLQHLPPANLTRFIHNHDRAFSQFTLEEKAGDSRRRPKSSLLHLDYLLSLRRENDNAPARLPKLFDQLTQNKTLARARAATKERDGVR